MLLLLFAVPSFAIYGELIPGPNASTNVTVWMEGLILFKQIARRGWNDSVYRSMMKWTQRSYIQPQVMVHERTLLSDGDFDVQGYLKLLKSRYGGIDSVLLWPTYPNMGIDDRNQFDMTLCLGERLQRAVKEFHRHGVRVLFPYNPWDVGTRPSNYTGDAAAVHSLLAYAKADGFNGDTMTSAPFDFFSNVTAIEPEEFINATRLWYTKMGWGYWQNDTTGVYDFIPGVDKMRWIEQRHMTHVCDRWSRNKTDPIQLAFFNGAGVETWENVWGIFNAMTPRDCEFVRRVASILRYFSLFFTDGGWVPHTQDIVVASSLGGVFASKWTLGNASLWTIVNRVNVSALVNVVVKGDDKCFDVYHGEEGVTSITVEGLSIGSILCVGGGASVPPHFGAFLASQQAMTKIPLNSFSTEFSVTLQQIVPIEAAPHANTSGMVFMEAMPQFRFKVQGIEIEGGNQTGVDFQYPWETEPLRYHDRVLSIDAFYVDKYPATNDDWLAFVTSSHYVPKGDSHNYLKHWVNGSYPPTGGWQSKPVVWIGIEDARAYCSWRGKRLLNEWEWARVASSGDPTRYTYPWGNSWNPNCVPVPQTGRTMGPPDNVDAHPCGATADGVMDLVGNTYTWLNEFRDLHTRAAVLRGSGYYSPQGSGWYWRTAKRIDQHAKYLLADPAIDRSGAIGIRCASD